MLLVSFFVYDKFNDLFLVVCVFSALSLVNNNTRLCHVFVVYLVVVSTVFFFFSLFFGFLYSVSKYYGAWGIRGT